MDGYRALGGVNNRDPADVRVSPASSTGFRLFGAQPFWKMFFANVTMLEISLVLDVVTILLYTNTFRTYITVRAQFTCDRRYHKGKKPHKYEGSKGD